jgi:hypothetical protein
MRFFHKKFAYTRRVLPTITLHALRSVAPRPVHIIFALADHFEPAFDPTSGYKRVARDEQLRREEVWFREYPKVIDRPRDHDGRPLVHTYFYPAEQYDEELVEMLAEHCHSGWGETEIHLHHGMQEPDTAENTRRQIVEFRDQLAFRHRCLSVADGSADPRYAFVHGNFALANSAGGLFCGVDSEMQILGETGCYADFTMPSSVWHPAQTAKVNSIYECRLPLDRVAPQSKGRNLAVGRGISGNAIGGSRLEMWFDMKMYFDKFSRWPRKSLVIYAKYDLTFLPEFSRRIVEEFAAHHLDNKVVALPCGHYSLGEFPYNYLDGWHLASFLRSAFETAP